MKPGLGLKIEGIEAGTAVEEEVEVEEEGEDRNADLVGISHAGTISG